jgi:hypothetical protein
MQDFSSLELAMHRAVLLSGSACLALLAITIASLAFAVAEGSRAHELGLRMPVLVVPGAVGGVYSPGLSEDNVRASARYLSSLATNFGSPRSFHERFDELETFAAAPYLPQLQAARRGLQHDVETQGQARSFVAAPGSEQLQQVRPGHFVYRVRGERVVYAGGLPMDRRPSETQLLLQWGTPSERNRAGVFLEGFSVADLSPESAGAPAPPPAEAHP